MTIYTLTSWLGTVLLLAAYGWLANGHRFARGSLYLVWNIIGTLLLMPNMIHMEIWSMVVFQTAWIWISVRGIYSAHIPRKIQQEKS